MSLPKKVFPFIFYFVRQQWIKFIFVIFASMVWGGNAAFFPYLLKRLINVLSSSRENNSSLPPDAWNLLLVMIVLWIGCNLLLRVQGFVMSCHFCATFRAAIRTALFQYVQTHSTAYFANNFSGTIANKISDLPINCETMLLSICFEFVTAFIGVLVVMGTMWVGHPIFALCLLAWLFLHFLMTFLFLKKGHYLFERHATSVTMLSGKIVDVFTNIQNVKLFAREEYERQYLNRFQKEEIKRSIHAYGFLEWMQVGFGINEVFLIFGMLFLLIRGWQHHAVSLGDFTQIMMQILWLSGWMWYISHQIKSFAKTAATVRSALSLIQQPHDILDVSGALPLAVSRGKICFDHVTFSYHHSLVFDNLNVTLNSGEKVGLVGLSGAGKTTFMNLLLRLYDLKGGTITIDGQSIAEVTQESLHENIAVIPQDSILFNRTLLENISYGRLEATKEEVIEASKKAECHEFIEGLQDGYETFVGERGIKLSGGQRQRIAIARALLKNAPILILDEATSSLDSATEKKIQAGLDLVMKERTTIVIAHRLSTLAAMDRILVFDEGKIVEDGTIPFLLEKKGAFSKFWKMQQEGIPEI